ncbi:MAG: enoyl-CoA hydratase-related protein [Pseudomonadota bacterium]
MTQGLRYDSGAKAIILDQPDKRNAISAEMWAALQSAVQNAEADPDCKVVKIYGAGEHFAAGADITEFEQAYATKESAAIYTQTMLDGLSALEACAKPTIAVIRGVCVGGGCSLALACDFRFGAASARIGVTPGKLGLVYSADDTRRLIRAVGTANAKQLLMTADIISADKAKRIGFLDAMADDSTLDNFTREFIAKIEGLSQWSVRATKKMFALLHEGDQSQADTLMLSSFEGEDFKEGYKSFLEKRRPKFPAA